MNDEELQNQILTNLSPIDPIWSNALWRILHVNKNRFHRIRDMMIDEKIINAKRVGRNLLLTRSDFEASSKYTEKDWTRIAKINCDTFLNYLKDRKPLFSVTKKKKINIRKNKKVALDAFFHELDRLMIVCIRLVNAEALGLISSRFSRYHQKECVEFVQKQIKKLLNDHKEFKEEIKEYAQSQLRTVQFKI